MKKDIGFEILPRDYGISILNGNKKIFFSPFKYAIGKVFLENKDDLTQRIQRFKANSNLKSNSLEADLLEEIRKKEKNLHLINSHPIENVKLYANQFVGELYSKKGEKMYITSIAQNRNEADLISSVSCNCLDNVWGGPKNKEVVCIHLATLNTALTSDYRNRTNTPNSHTGLFPRERFNFALPFDFYSSEENDFLITKSLIDYYLEGKSIYQINRGLLSDFNIISKELFEKYAKSEFRLSFEVLRQKKRNEQNLNQNQSRYVAAVSKLNQRLEGKLGEELGFKFDGYSLEFKDTQNETISKRFRKGYEVYTICNIKRKPPILIRKLIGDKSQMGFFENGTYNSQLFLDGRNYESLDDFTKRNTLSKIIIPNPKKIFIPKSLQRIYNREYIDNSNF